jgi:hypothetical protein
MERLSRRAAVAPRKAVSVSVLIVTYNCRRYLPIAVESILNQSFPDLELIVLDNASTDDTRQYLDSITDERLVRLTNDVNGGPQAANLGFPHARGKYIARLDADDVALPGRIRQQYDFLESHPDYILCGAEYESIQDDGTITGRSFGFHDPYLIRWKLGWLNFIGHSTIMGRRDEIVAAGGYNPSLWCAEDYDLLSRLSLSHKIDVLPDILVRYRVYPTSISHQRKAEMLNNSRAISMRHIERVLGHSAPLGVLVAAIEIMREEACSLPQHFWPALALIREYTLQCASRSPRHQARQIRQLTAKHLVTYGRHYLKDRNARTRIEVHAARLDPLQLAKRVANRFLPPVRH